jgi:uncharacterized protein (TIGR00255 family)
VIAAVRWRRAAGQGDGALAQRRAVDAGAQRAPDQALDLQGAAALLAARGLAVAARMGGARQHPVFRGHPALALAAQERRNLVVHAGGAQHPGVAETHQHRTLGVAGEPALDADFAHLVGCATAGAGDVHVLRFRQKTGRQITIGASPEARRRGTAMPIRSMTAYASGERTTPWGTLGCELRAVNHRFLELGTRLPDELRALEPALRERIAARVSRGKLDLTLRLRPGDGTVSLQLDEALVQRLGELAGRLRGHFPELRVGLVELLQFPGVLQSQGVDPAELHAQVLELVDAVLDDFIAGREREGAKLVAAILERVDGIERIAGDVRALVPEIREAQRTRLQARLAELAQAADPGRVEQELVLALQKLDVDEELDRLASHVDEIRRVFTQREPVGRRLDFLLQEFNREANTLGSKSVDARTSRAAVELKVLIDQIREQVQNIE